MWSRKSVFPIVILIHLALSTAGQPAILSHPTDTSVCAGAAVTFEVLASNADFYQWQEYDGTGWFDIEDDVSYASGENTATLTLSDVITGLNDYQYRCYVEDENGESVISNPATLNVYEAPLINIHPVDKVVCKNETATFQVGADNVTDYQWQENRGSGWYNLQDNSFYEGAQTDQLNIFTVFGINNYQYRCKVFNNSCSDLSEEAVLTVNPLPQVFFLTGGGTICEGDAGVSISLTGSQEGINYELIRNDTSTVAVKPGTGQPIEFGLFGQEGAYTSRAINSQTSCINSMTGQVEIEVNPQPQSFEVLTTGTFCEGGSGAEVFMENSQQGIVYELYLNGNATGNQVEGTGGMVSFSNIVNSGSFGIKATNPQTGCQAFMNNTVTVEETTLPEVFTFSGNGIICESSEGANLTLSGSETQVTYHLLRNGEPTSSTLPGDGDTIVFNNVSVQGVYSVKAVRDNSSCEQIMEGTVEVTPQAAPSVFEVNGDEYLCPGSEGVITLSNSEEGTNYHLFRNNESTGNVKTGTGEVLEFMVDQAGTYTIRATFPGNGCENMMSGEASLQEAGEVVADAGDNQQINENEQATLIGTASGGSGDYSWNWEPVEYLENPQNQNPITVALSGPHIFTLEAVDNVTGCSSPKDSTHVTLANGAFQVEASAASDSICQENSVQLFALVQGGSGNYSYYWYSPNGDFTSVLQNPVVSPLSTQQYIVQVDDGVSTVEDTLTITVNELPEIFELTGETNFCSGGEGATLNLSGSESGVTYYLFRNGFSMQELETPVSFTVSNGGGYTVQASHQGCNTMMDGYVEVEQFETPYASAGEKETVYEGETAQLQGEGFGGSGDYTFSWSPEGYLQEPQVQSPQTVPVFLDMYFSLTVADDNTGCESAPDSVLVQTQGSQLQLQVSASNTQVCSGSEVVVSAIAQGGTEDYEYQWVSNPPGFSSVDSVIYAYPEVPTWYVVTLSDGVSTITDSIYIDIAASPAQYSITGGGQMCEDGVGVEIGLSGSDTGVYYELMSSADQEIINAVQGTGNAISFGIVDEPGSYEVTATHSTSGCQEQMNPTAEVFTMETPQAMAGEDHVIGQNETAVLNGYGNGGSGEYAYFWSPASKVINPTQPSTSTVNLTNSTLFTLEVTDEATGCTSPQDSVLISVSGNSLNLSLQVSSQTICRGEAVHIFALAGGGSGEYTYNWSSDPGGVSASGYSATVYPQQPTTYTIVVNDGGNSISKSVEVEVEEIPSVIAQDDTTVFFGEEATLSATAQGGSGEYQYHWYPEGYISGGQGPTVETVPMLQSSSFRIELTDLQSGCYSIPDTVDVNIEGNDLNVMAFASTDTICKGRRFSVVALPSGGSGDYSYSWSADPGGIISGQSFVSIAVDTTTTFYVNVDDGVSTTTDSVRVAVIPSPEKYVLAGDKYYCEGEPGTFLKLNNSDNGIQYQLQRNDLFSGIQKTGSGQPLVFENITNEGFYTIQAVNSTNWCVESMLGSVNVTRASNPARFSLTGEGSYCDGETFNIGVEGSEQGVLYRLYANQTLWDSLTGTGSAISFPVAAGDSLFIVEAVNKETGCISMMQDALSIEVFPLPEVETTPDTAVYSGQQVVLTASGGESYEWNTTPPSQGPTLTVTPKDTVIYTVEVTNKYGCTKIDSIKVKLKDAQAPQVNAFTPNGDGTNDIFLEGYHIKVFNRWGKVLYEGKDGWDGTYNGKPVPAGTYYYIRTTNNAGEEIKVVKGDVTVVRRNE